MNMFEEARSLKGMMKMLSITQDEMAKKLGVSQSYVANKLRLLKYSGDCEKIIIDGALSERHARAVLRLNDDAARISALKRICERRLTVAESEALVDLLHDGDAPRRIGNAERIFCVDTFKDTLKRSLSTLKSLGVDATQSISYYGKKTYITVCIDEGYGAG